MKGDMKTKLQHNGKKTGDVRASLEAANVRDRNNILTEFRCRSGTVDTPVVELVHCPEQELNNPQILACRK